MKLAIGSDERTHITDAVVAEVRRRGHEVALLAGPLQDLTGGAIEAAPENNASLAPPVRSENYWPAVARAVAEAVASGAADEGILFCWTGTGVSLAANKVPGIRAALCDDAETARGARLWNNANVLCLSLRRTSEVVAQEILDTWFNTSFEPNETDDACLAQLAALEAEKLGIKEAFQ
jgi:ribose 5-phosphate isomerase B